MKTSSIVLIVFLFNLIITSCQGDIEAEKIIVTPLPKELINVPNGIEVVHTPSYVYASINQKDPAKRGVYQLEFNTTVIAINEDLEIVEFGGYDLINDEWVLYTVYDRPFNKEEFSSWYGCENGILKKGVAYSDSENWIAKSDVLSGRKVKSLWYFIAKNKQGTFFKGVEIVEGVLELEQ